MSGIPTAKEVITDDHRIRRHHRTLQYRGENTGLYVAAFDDGTTFFSRRQPRLYDASARPMALREVIPGSCVRPLP
jgi:hypothetical protein